MSCEDVTADEDNASAAKARIKWIVDSVKELDAKRTLASHEFVEKEEDMEEAAQPGNVSIHNVELLDVDSLDLEDEDSWYVKLKLILISRIFQDELLYMITRNS